jgi:hypothetical protein
MTVGRVVPKPAIAKEEADPMNLLLDCSFIGNLLLEIEGRSPIYN